MKGFRHVGPKRRVSHRPGMSGDPPLARLGLTLIGGRAVGRREARRGTVGRRASCGRRASRWWARDCWRAGCWSARELLARGRHWSARGSVGRHATVGRAVGRRADCWPARAIGQRELVLDAVEQADEATLAALVQIVRRPGWMQPPTAVARVSWRPEGAIAEAARRGARTGRRRGAPRRLPMRSPRTSPSWRASCRFARELAWALVRAAIAGATTRATAELLAALHGQGHLRTVPSDPVCRGSPIYR
jgi:hypothetical protein